MALHRYWRIQAKAVEAGTNFSLAEFQMRIVAGGADQTAPGGAVAASSTFAGSAAANAVDDNTTTWWATLTNQHIDGFISYDFGAPVEIVEVVLTARDGVIASARQAPSIFHVAGSNDNVTWTDYKRHTAAAWGIGSSQTFAVPLTPAVSGLRVSSIGLEVMHNSARGNLRVSSVALEVLRSVAVFVPPVGGRRRTQQIN